MTSMSPAQEAYFASLESELSRVYAVAQDARAKGYDYDTTVSIPLAQDMAERVEGLISVVAPQLKGVGLSQRIQELEGIHGSQNWKISFLIALEVAQQKFCTFSSEHQAMEVGLRVGLMYLTNGVVASPLEGFIRLELKDRQDGQGKFFSLYFGGPIRSAGTTATCIFIACADYVRQQMGYLPYDPTPDEIKRYFCEVEYFHERVTNLQYLPTEAEVTFLATHLPVQIEGDASEEVEVPNYKHLSRVSTDKLRNGFCLVVAEGLCQKSKKFWGKFSSWYRDMGMDYWIFLEGYVDLQKKVKSSQKMKADPSSEKKEKISADYTYIKDLVAGRPILSHPLRHGGFRLRYGRCRTSGFSTDAIHPATMIILEEYIAIGTQLKVERPGKSTSLAVCDLIEGPIVKLLDGSVVCVTTEAVARHVKSKVAEILYLGDLLINFGDFFNRAHLLMPVGYCEEWWAQELACALGDARSNYASLLDSPLVIKPDFSVAYQLSLQYKVALHPQFTYHWRALSVPLFVEFLHAFASAALEEAKIVFALHADSTFKRALELLGVPCQVVGSEYVVVAGDAALALRCSLGALHSTFDLPTALSLVGERSDVLLIVNDLSEVILQDKSGSFIGARMGRPEKAKMRKMTGSPQVLFPVGNEGGRLRSFQAALEKGYVTADFAVFFCSTCNQETVYAVCHRCLQKSVPLFFDREGNRVAADAAGALRSKKMRLPLAEYFSSALAQTGLSAAPELIKGVRGTSNKHHIVEHLTKGILRAHHGVYINKDGTTRYDMTEMPLTHFKPFEIGTSIARLFIFGYTHDIFGAPLEREDQILELKCQDFLLPACPESLDESGTSVFFHVANFLDDLLVKLYGLSAYYNLRKKEDIIGHLFVGLSPHTCAGIVCRAIGYSQTQVLLAHPYLHSIMRRDTDGDEAGVMLLMDALLNFSRHLIGSHRGATQDEPLVLTSRILPGEVDDMVFDMDIAWQYPLALYEAAAHYASPSEVTIALVKSQLGTAGQYEGFGFTHDTTSLNAGVRCGGYKLLPTIQQKVEVQMRLAEKLRCVDASDVARLVIERHFIRDIIGNLSKFSMQQFRCVACNAKYRRPPLSGTCSACHGKLLFTISEGSVTKYLAPSLSLATTYAVPAYLRQTLALTQQRIVHVFGKDAEKQEGLGRWFG